MARVLHDYISMPTDELLTTRPIADPLNAQSVSNELAFGEADPQCVRFTEKPKAYKTKDNKNGFVKPACAYWCHDHIAVDDVETSVTITDEGYIEPETELQPKSGAAPVIQSVPVPKVIPEMNLESEQETSILDW